MGIFNFFKQEELPTPPSSNSNSSTPDIKYLEKILKTWLDGKTREEQLLGEKYYDGDHDILRREKKVIGADGNLITLTNVANNKSFGTLQEDVKACLRYLSTSLAGKSSIPSINAPSITTSSVTN